MDRTICARCGWPLDLRDSEAPRFVHPDGEPICRIETEDGELDSGEPVPAADWPVRA